MLVDGCKHNVIAEEMLISLTSTCSGSSTVIAKKHLER